MNLWLLVASFYLLPLIISFWMIQARGLLLGDFAFAPVYSSWWQLGLIGLIYLLPGVAFTIAINLFSKIKIKSIYGSSTKFYKFLDSKLLCRILIFATIGAAIFGLPTISGGVSGNSVSPIQNLILYLNPSILFMLISISNASLRDLLISACCLIFIGFVQLSLLPLVIVAIGGSIWWFIRYPVTLLKFISLVFLIIFYINLGKDYVYLLYDIRNNARGAADIFDIDQLFVYAIGRINSFSSLYYLWDDKCCEVRADYFYLITTVLERFVGVDLPSFSSSEAFNQKYLDSGSGVYSIFASYAGQFVIDYNSDALLFLTSTFSALVLLFITYYLIPYPAKKEKIPIFFLFIFPVYLSGDAWEFSVFIRSLVIINIILFFSMKFHSK